MYQNNTPQKKKVNGALNSYFVEEKFDFNSDPCYFPV